MKQFLFSFLILTFFFLLPLSKNTPVSAAACGDWTLGKPTISGHDATFSINPPAGGDNVLAVRGMSGNNRDVPISSGATSIRVSLPDDWYRAVIVYITCEISNTQNFAIPDGETGIGSDGGSAECTSFDTCTTIDTPAKPDPTKFGDSTFIVDLVSQFLPIALGMGGFLSVIIIVISGLQFITSNGNPEGAAGARGRLIFALVGFVLLILAFALTKVIDTIFLKSGAV